MSEMTAVTGLSIAAMTQSLISAGPAHLIAATTTDVSTGSIIGLSLAIYLIYAIALMLLFHKAGRNPLWGLIPIVSTVVLLQIVGRSGWWILFFLIPIVNIIVLIIVYYDLSRSFGHGIPFTLGLIFFSVIFLLILGLAGRYEGPAARVGS